MRYTPVAELDFLRLELRYILTELDTQINRLRTESALGAELPARVGEALGAMDSYERHFQSRYAAILGAGEGDTGDIQTGDSEVDFAHRRQQTLRLLEGCREAPPRELVDLVHEHLALDRKHVTDIADQRPGVLARIQRERESGDHAM